MIMILRKILSEESDILGDIYAGEKQIIRIHWLHKWLNQHQ